MFFILSDWFISVIVLFVTLGAARRLSLNEHKWEATLWAAIGVLGIVLTLVQIYYNDYLEVALVGVKFVFAFLAVASYLHIRKVYPCKYGC